MLSFVKQINKILLNESFEFFCRNHTLAIIKLQKWYH